MVQTCEGRQALPQLFVVKGEDSSETHQLAEGFLAPSGLIVTCG